MVITEMRGNKNKEQMRRERTYSTNNDLNTSLDI